MRKNTFLALLAVVFMAMPAAASVQNIKVSGDVDSYWLYRDQFDLGQANMTRFTQNLLFTQTRLRVDADLTDQVSTTVALLNERVWGNDAETNGSNDIDLNLAYVELREMLYSPLTVVIGRQNFAFGNSFVIDSAGANNTVDTGGLNGAVEDFTKRTAQDAVRMTFDYNPLTLDVLASKVASNNNLGTGLKDDDIDLFGVNANYELGDALETVVEAYFWARIDQSAKNTAGDKADSVYMPGLRVATNPLKGLNLSAEVAWQRGNKTETDGTPTTIDNVKREATAAQLIANYMLPFDGTAQYNPVMTTAYTYVSGDSNAGEPGDIAGGNKEDTFTAWDPMFENQAGGTIYNSLFDLTNAHIVTVKTAASPIEDVTAWLQWDGIWTDKEPRATTEVSGTCWGADCFTMRQPDGTTTNPRMTANNEIGHEIGLGLDYDYTEDVQFGARYGWFFPGDAFHNDNQERATQVLVHGNVNF